MKIGIRIRRSTSGGYKSNSLRKVASSKQYVKMYSYLAEDKDPDISEPFSKVLR